MILSNKQKLGIIGTMGVIALFVLLTFAQNWGKATAQRDIKQARKAARACVTDPRAAARQCAYAAREIGEALPEIEAAHNKAEAIAAHKILAQVSMAMGKYGDAARSYEQVAVGSPQQSQPYRDIALAYSLSGEHRAASHYATLARQLAPGSWKAAQLQGQVLYRAGKFPAALKSMEQAIELAPSGDHAELIRAVEAIKRRLPRGNLPGSSTTLLPAAPIVVPASQASSS